MMDLRIEVTDDATGLYISIDGEKVPVAKTTQPDELVMVDWDADGKMIGVEVIGSPVRPAITAFLESLMSTSSLDDPEAVREAFQHILNSD